MKDIKIAIAGIGNCASSLIQGIFYYKNSEEITGLMHSDFGGYHISDIKPVAAFDIDKRKVGMDLSRAIFAEPNCTEVFFNNVPLLDVKVKQSPVLDGVAPHMKSEKGFIINDDVACDVSDELKASKADILVNYVPVGSEKTAEYFAQCCLDSGVAMINCMPVFIASNMQWQKRFEEKKLPIIGDDIKSQIGATIIHRVLTKLFADRGVKIDHTYQLNVGGNTDFLNMRAHERLKSKKKSKTNAVQSQLPRLLEEENIHIGPSDYIPWLKDRKVCFIRIEGRKFGNLPVELELRLSVEDSPNSAGSVIDAIRAAKIALDRGIYGSLESISAYTMKSPPVQFSDSVAKEMVDDFIQGKRKR